MLGVKTCGNFKSLLCILRVRYSYTLKILHDYEI